MGIFDCILDLGNYDDRVIGRFEDDRSGLIVSTARVSDGRQPIETGVKHPNYHDRQWIIVEAYNDHESAQAGHDDWVASMTTDPLPDELADCLNSELAQAFLDPGSLVFRRSQSGQPRTPGCKP